MRWYAVLTKPRREWLAEKNLRFQGYPTFYPHYSFWTTPTRTKPRLMNKDYLTRYIFTALTDNPKHSIYQVNNTIGVSTVVYCGPQALEIPIEIVEELQSRADEKGIVEPDKAPSFPGRPGDIIKFCDTSPLFGFLAEIRRVDKDGKLMVRLDKLFGTEREIPIKAADVGAIIQRDKKPSSRPSQ